MFGGALYVIAVNAGTRAAAVHLRAPGLAGRPLHVAGTQGWLASQGATFAAELPPMSVRIYIAPPSGVP